MVLILKLQRVDSERDYFIPVVKSAIKELSPIELLVMIYLYRYRTLYADLVLLSINHLVTSCGYIPNNRKSRTGHCEGISIKFVNALNRFIEDGLININDDIVLADLKPSDLFQIQLNMEKINYFANVSFENKSDDEKKESSFVMLEFTVMDKLTKSGTTDVAGLIYFYLYIKQYISIDEGRKYKQFAFVTNENIKENVIISNNKLYDSFVTILQDLQLMFRHNFGYRSIDGMLVQIPNAYVLKTEYFKNAYKDVKKRYKMCSIIPYNNGAIENHSDKEIELTASKVIVDDIKQVTKVNMNPFKDDTDSYNNFSIASDKVDKPKSLENMSDLDWLKELKDDMQDEGDDDIPESIAIGDNWGIGQEISDDELDELLFG